MTEFANSESKTVAIKMPWYEKSKASLISNIMYAFGFAMSVPYCAAGIMDGDPAKTVLPVAGVLLTGTLMRAEKNERPLVGESVIEKMKFAASNPSHSNSAFANAWGSLMFAFNAGSAIYRSVKDGRYEQLGSVVTSIPNFLTQMVYSFGSKKNKSNITDDVKDPDFSTSASELVAARNGSGIMQKPLELMKNHGKEIGLVSGLTNSVLQGLEASNHMEGKAKILTLALATISTFLVTLGYVNRVTLERYSKLEGNNGLAK